MTLSLSLATFCRPKSSFPLDFFSIRFTSVTGGIMRSRRQL